MKYKIISLLLCIAWSVGWAQSGEGYDPENPADPNVYYTLVLEAAPRNGGYIYPSSANKLQAGESFYCEATAKNGYVFKEWREGETVVSVEQFFNYTMPSRNVTLTAYFDKTETVYNPDNPDDPMADGYSHRVRVYASPSRGGYFNQSNFEMLEGNSQNVYAYPENGYRFASWKCKGQIISAENPYQLIMGKEDVELTATFVYDPQNPDNPGANNFNTATGELLIDSFTPGYLLTAIENAIGGWDNMSLVQSMRIIGVFSPSDFGFSYNMRNCSLIDIARTTGLNEIPSWAFESMESLTKIILPSSVEGIGDYAFAGCENLSELVCYSTTPPTVGYNAFQGVSDGLVVRVPSSVMSLYVSADVWKDFTILPLDEETCSISVSLPSDAADGRYKNMTLELNNVSSGQVLRYLITERTSYVFHNLMRDTRYNLFVKSPGGDILGSILDINLGEDNIDVAFSYLLQPKNVELQILTPNGENVADEAGIIWSNSDGQHLGYGKMLKGVLEGTRVTYSITLPKDLALLYIAPPATDYEVASDDNVTKYQLDKFAEVVVSGKVINVSTRRPIPDANISISQVVNNKYPKSLTLRTDKDGLFSGTVYSLPFSMEVEAFDHISQHIDIDSPSASNDLGEIALKGITGAQINTTFTFRQSVKDGESADVQEFYSDYENVTYSIFNVSTDKPIKSFKVQYPNIVLLEEVSEGDVLRVTACSKSGSFSDVTAECAIDANNKAEVLLPIVALGGIEVVAPSTANDTDVAMLYDSRGELIRKETSSTGEFSIKDLQSGDYTIIVMGYSKFFNSVLNLEELSRVGLTVNSDYLRVSVSVVDGIISTVSIDAIPSFDESRFYYTDIEGTSFTANKASVTVGNYITLRGKVDFKEEYMGNISNVKMLFDLPEDCRFVDNSLLTGSTSGSYSIEGNRIAVGVEDLTKPIRFCIIPTKGGKCTPSAFVQFDLKGETVLQPIGSAFFEAESMNISVPSKTAFTAVTVKGVATANSSIKIFDNDALVANTTSIANGQWFAQVELYKPYNKSRHSLYAEITDVDGNVYYTDTKVVDYDKNYSIPSKITLIYNGTNIVFDMINGKNSSHTYTYVPSITNFTFLAQFTNNDTTLVKNLEFVVLLSNGTVKRIPAYFNGSKGLWVATDNFSQSDQIPVNVTVDYMFGEGCEIDNTESFEEQMDFIAACGDEILEYYNNNLVFEQTDDSETHGIFSCSLDGIEFTYEFNILDYAEAIEYIKARDYEYGISDETKISYCTEITDNGIIVTSALLDDEYAVRVSMSIPSAQDSRKGTRGVNIKPIISALRLSLNNGTFLSVLGDFGSNLCDIIGVGPYLRVRSDFAYMCDLVDSYYDSDIKWQQIITNLLVARCPDSSLKLSTDEIDRFVEIKNNIAEQATEFENQCIEYLTQYQQKLAKKIAYDLALLGVGKVIGAVGNTSKFINSKFIKWAQTYLSAGTSSATAASIMSNSLGMFVNFLSGISNPEFCDFTAVYDSFTHWAPLKFRDIVMQYGDLATAIKAAYKNCDSEVILVIPIDEHLECDFPNDNLTPSIDPSGYVYEAVSTNRVPGVTSTIFYKEMVEDMYGDLHENIVKWDAAEYAQENPVFTDENGMYRWDVPQGLWQVKFEKDGYETAFSEWLPVPPPQLDVNVAIKQNRQPEVKMAKAFADGVEIEFDKYMIPSTLTTDNIIVMQGDAPIEGSVQLLNEDTAEDGITAYASRIRFVPITSFSGNEITLLVSNKVQSYAGIRMQENFMQSFVIEPEIKSIECEPDVIVEYGKTTTLNVKAAPANAAAGKMLIVSSSSPIILSIETETVEFDDDGYAIVRVNGELPGSASVTYTIDGYDISASSMVTVANIETLQCAAPECSIESGSEVEAGTEIFLTCATEGATIYYTLDGSCPCDDSDSRLIYDGTPIIVTEDLTIHAMATAPGFTESEVVVFTFSVSSVSSIGFDTQLSVYPQPATDVLYVRSAKQPIHQIRLLNTNGAAVNDTLVNGNFASLNVANLPAGIYIIVVKTNDGIVSRRKLIKAFNN